MFDFGSGDKIKSSANMTASIMKTNEHEIQTKFILFPLFTNIKVLNILKYFRESPISLLQEANLT